jgi:hypothetical protein
MRSHFQRVTRFAVAVGLLYFTNRLVFSKGHSVLDNGRGPQVKFCRVPNRLGPLESGNLDQRVKLSISVDRVLPTCAARAPAQAARTWATCQ